MIFEQLEAEEAEAFHRRTRAKRLEQLTLIIQNELTQRQAQVVKMVLIEDKTFQEVAEELSVCRSTICRTYHRGMRKLARFAKYIN